MSGDGVTGISSLIEPGYDPDDPELFGDIDGEDVDEEDDNVPRGPTSMLDDLADALRGAGVRVELVDGWETRGKGWTVASPTGIVCHHTADAGPRATLRGTLHVVTHGNSVAPGPISQILLWRDGGVHVVAAGRANHAGKGSWPGVTSANSTFLGIEAANAGTGLDVWPASQMEAYVAICVALCDHYRIDPGRVIAHREWAPSRKIDPKGEWERAIDGMQSWADMGAWRKCIAQRLAVPHTAVPDRHTIPQKPPEDDDMTTTARLYRDSRYFNVWLIGAGPATQLSPKLADTYRQAGIPEVVDEHPQTLRSILHQSGMSDADLVPVAAPGGPGGGPGPGG